LKAILNRTDKTSLTPPHF